MNPVRNLALYTLLGFALCGVAQAGRAPALDRDALSFDRYALTSQDLVGKLKPPLNKAGLAGSEGWGATGWFEYDFSVRSSGWYELHSAMAGKYRSVEYIIDPQLFENKAGGIYLYGTGQGLSAGDDKVSNIWLDAGEHVLRVQQYYWTGFPAIKHLTISPSPGNLKATARVAFSGTTTVFRKRQCMPIEIYSGGSDEEKKLTVFVSESSSGKQSHRYVVTLPESQGLVKQELPVFCSEVGEYVVSFGNGVGKPISKRDIGHLRYEVIDPQPGNAPLGDLRKTLIEEIDCANMEPDYSGGGLTRVQHTSFGAYRESGDVGWKQYQQLSTPLRALAPEPSWFAYSLHINRPGHPYIIEVDYPDDALRTFAIAIRERKPIKYPVAGGVDSGGEFSITRSMATQSLIFWPTAKNPRIVLMNARSGARAAAAKIRVYRVDGEFPALDVAVDGGRSFANWYEEGRNFTSLYGVTGDLGESSIAVNRWARLARHMGINVLYPTVSVYNFNFYPSKYNRAFSSPPWDDMLRRMLLVAEQNDLKLLPDLHPRSDDLSWHTADNRIRKDHLLVSKDGKTLDNMPPHFNPIYPGNQDWYVGMIGEIVDRYKDSPALLGVSLRVMQWQNPTLNNFHSLDWGYGDYTVDTFERETGIAVPIEEDDPGRFRKRYDWLMENAKDRWIDWRSEKITQLYKRIVERVRAARPDFKVHALVSDAYPSEYGMEWMLSAGMDVRRLAEVEGLVLINALHAYGRLYDDQTTQGTRDNLLDPTVLGGMRGANSMGRVLPYTRYFEATDVVIPPESLGFESTTKKTWTSAVVNPAGRHILERFALALAETDADFLGDGGNGFTIGQPILRDFLREYRALPAMPFSMREDARDPVAVWELRAQDAFYFYVVNRERFPVDVVLMINGVAEVTRLATGDGIDSTDGVLKLHMEPYQLLAFKSSPDGSIARVVTDIPDNELTRVERQVDWLLARSEEIRSGALLPNLPAEKKQRLQDLASEASLALEKGWVWRARTIIENHALMSIYKMIKAYPPGLRNAIIATE